jgi:hypothetical protein
MRGAHAVATRCLYGDGLGGDPSVYMMVARADVMVGGAAIGKAVAFRWIVVLELGWSSTTINVVNK